MGDYYKSVDEGDRLRVSSKTNEPTVPCGSVNGNAEMTTPSRRPGYSSVFLLRDLQQPLSANWSSQVGVGGAYALALDDVGVIVGVFVICSVYRKLGLEWKQVLKSVSWKTNSPDNHEDA